MSDETTQPVPEPTQPQPSPEVSPTSDVGQESSDSAPATNNPNITITKTPDSVTITEVMQPASAPSFGVAKQKNLWGKFLEKVNFNKKKKLEKIMSMATQKRKIKNTDVEKLIRASDSTASRYLKELVKMGRLRQSGKGPETYYEPL